VQTEFAIDALYVPDGHILQLVPEELEEPDETSSIKSHSHENAS